MTPRAKPAPKAKAGPKPLPVDPDAPRECRPLVSLRRALEDPALLGAIMGGPSRIAMRVLLLASQGEELTDDELAIYRQLTGREDSPLEPVREGHIIAGRRSGKSYSIAALTVYLAALCDWSSCLSHGETGRVLILASSIDQAAVLLDYVAGAFNASDVLAKMIVGRTKSTLTLSNGIVIDVRAADFRRIRGMTLIACLCDEIAFWRDQDAVNPATEVIRAVRPMLSTTRGQMFTISSPYAKVGFQYEVYRRHHGPDGDHAILVAKGPTSIFNPTIDPADIARAMQEDPEAARSEWLGEFRDDIAAFLSAEAWDACVERDRRELPRADGSIYTAFVDPSGGRGDSFTLAIAHHDKRRVIVDLVREWRPPFNPDNVVAELAPILKTYGLSRVTGDNFAAEWVVSAFRRVSLHYVKSERVRSELYLDLLPLINARRIEMPDHSKLRAQAIALERRLSKVGRDTINHPTGGHDDLINAVAGAAVYAHDKCGQWNHDAIRHINGKMGVDSLMRRFG